MIKNLDNKILIAIEELKNENKGISIRQIAIKLNMLNSLRSINLKLKEMGINLKEKYYKLPNNEIELKKYNKLDNIKKYPTLYDNIHESLFKSYQILQIVKEMIKRGDSIQTIEEIIEFLEN